MQNGPHLPIQFRSGTRFTSQQTGALSHRLGKFLRFHEDDEQGENSDRVKDTQ